MRSISERLSHLRGSLPYKEPGARGWEKAARNLSCHRIQVLTIAGIPPGRALAAVYGEIPCECQSPFALGVGSRFEHVQFDLGGARVLKLYRSAGRLGIPECKVADMSLDVIGGRIPDMEVRKDETLRLMKMKLEGNTNAPNLIIKPRLSISLHGRGHDIEPDGLAASDSEDFYRPIEVKAYPDRAGKTSAADIRSACRQAAVGVVALRQMVQDWGIPDPARVVPAATDIILRRPGSNWASLRILQIESEVSSIEKFFGSAPRMLEAVEARLRSKTTMAALDDPATLDSIPNNYREDCGEFCALAGQCKKQALVQDDPILLGGHAKEELSNAGTISRALDLLHGRGAPPANPEEQALCDRLQGSFELIRKVVGDGL